MPIAILGTGRSGTSMVTRMLNLCGLYLGDQDDLWDHRSNPHMNPTGYWEHREIHSLMDRLFEHLGGTWENPPLLPDNWEYSAAIEPFYVQAKEIVSGRFGDHENWAWKLPKATVTIAFWRRVIPDLRFIICVRNPLDFAQSLGKHTSVSRSHLFAMWQYYNYTILNITEPENRLVTFYDDYFPCYRKGLMPLLDFAGLPRPVPDDEVDQQIKRFCDHSLKHYTSTIEDVLTDAEAPYVTQQLYLELLSGDASASAIPILKFREMVQPLLQRALIGEGLLDGTGAVSKAKYDKLKRKLIILRGKRRWRTTFFRSIFHSLGHST